MKENFKTELLCQVWEASACLPIPPPALRRPLVTTTGHGVLHRGSPDREPLS